MAKVMRKSARKKMTSSNSLASFDAVSETISKMNVGEVSEEDKRSIVDEINSNLEVVELETSLLSIIFGDILTLVIFSTGLYMIWITVVNSITWNLIK